MFESLGHDGIVPRQELGSKIHALDFFWVTIRACVGYVLNCCSLCNVGVASNPASMPSMCSCRVFGYSLLVISCAYGANHSHMLWIGIRCCVCACKFACLSVCLFLSGWWLACGDLWISIMYRVIVHAYESLRELCMYNVHVCSCQCSCIGFIAACPCCLLSCALVVWIHLIYLCNSLIPFRCGWFVRMCSVRGCVRQPIYMFLFNYMQ